MRTVAEIVRSCLTEEWQSIDDVVSKCTYCGISRNCVSHTLFVLYRQGAADRRYNPHFTHRTWQYRRQCNDDL